MESLARKITWLNGDSTDLSVPQPCQESPTDEDPFCKSPQFRAKLFLARGFSTITEHRGLAHDEENDIRAIRFGCGIRPGRAFHGKRTGESRGRYWRSVRRICCWLRSLLLPRGLLRFLRCLGWTVYRRVWRRLRLGRPGLLRQRRLWL